MAAIPFQIEAIEPAIGFVLARQLEHGRFVAGPETRLGGYRVVELSLPPTENVDTLTADLHAFRLLDREDAKRLKVGDVVQLSEYRVET